MIKSLDKNHEPTIVRKLWGYEKWLHNGADYCMKELHLLFGFSSSLHMHKAKRETFLVVVGEVSMEYDGQIGTMRPGDYIEIMPGKYHRFASLVSFSRIIEASTPHEDADVFRKEPSRHLQ